MVAHYRRHEAPVISVGQGLDDSACAFFFQGVMSNRRSQPLLVDWFVVELRHQDGTVTDSAVMSMQDFVERVGLQTQIVNTGQDADVSALLALRTDAVQLATGHMQKLRQARAQELKPVLKAEKKRLKAWQQEQAARIDRRKQSLSAGGKLRSDQERRLQEEERRIEQIMHQRDTWLMEGMTTSDEPYLRLVLLALPQSYAEAFPATAAGDKAQSKPPAAKKTTSKKKASKKAQSKTKGGQH